MLIKKLLTQLVTGPAPYSLDTRAETIQEQPLPDTLIFSFQGYGKDRFSRPIKVGESVEAGTYLAAAGDCAVQPCPVKGKVKNLKHVPNVRGGEPLSAVFVDTDKNAADAAFPGLDWRKTTREEILKRIEQAGVLNFVETLSPLVELFSGPEEKSIVLAALDFEVNLKGALELCRERRNDLTELVAFIKKAAGVKQISVAMLEPGIKEFSSIFSSAETQTIAIRPVYPENLPRRIMQESRLNNPKLLPVETAFAAFEAVSLGRIQNKKIVTILSPEGEALSVCRFHLGTPIKDALNMAEIKVEDGDNVIVGGLFNGTGQYSLDGAIDVGVNALMVIPKKNLPAWSHDPCVSCGSCNSICPVNLQVSLIGRYSEFGQHEAARRLDIDACIDCGLCATACTVRRPLLQLVKLAKISIQDKENADKDIHEPKQEGQKPGMFQDPALALYSTKTRLTVGAAPFVRAKTSLSFVNFAYILVLVPVVLVSAIAFMQDSYVANQGTAFGAIPGLLNMLIGQLGVGPNVLMLVGVLGVAALGMGTGVLAEYAIQVAFRQRYEATNGHGALMGLLVAFLMPPTVSPFILMLAVAIAILVGKQLYGGIGSYPMHPAVVGWLIVFISYPHDTYPIGVATIGSVHLATMIALILAGLVLWVLGAIRIRVPLGVLIGVALFSLIFQSKLHGSILDQLFSGHVMLAAFFLATDSTTSPANKWAGWLYGFGIGFMIVLIRAFGVWPDAIPFAIMLMNIVNPLLDRIRPKVIRGAV